MSKYPLHIGSVPLDCCDRPHQRSIIRGKAYLGEIDTHPMDGDDPVREELEQLCAFHGYQFNQSHPGPYSPFDYTFGAGSARPHIDGGMGLTAGVLVAIGDLSRSLPDESFYPDQQQCILAAGGDFLPIGVGDAFIFNADKEHAWIANCRWVIAIQSVSRLRKRRVG